MKLDISAIIVRNKINSSLDASIVHRTQIHLALVCDRETKFAVSSNKSGNRIAKHGLVK